jgi:hypothetical protein
MTALSGSIAASPLGSTLIAAITSALDQYATDYWPPHTSGLDGAITGVLSAHWPVEAVPRVKSGSLAARYLDDFYDRIHVIPASIDLGNLVSSQTRTISVWNAWRGRSVELQALTEDNADGINLTGAEPPQTFMPLQQRDWTVGIDQSGPSIIDATLSWVFDNGEVVQSAITGRRIVAWMLPPDWSDGITETLAWLTDLQQADDGSQLREVLREAPRREWQFGVVAGGRQRRILESAIYDWGARTWALPVWPDVTWLTAPVAAGSNTLDVDTRHLDYVVGGLALLYHDERMWEVVEISAVADAQLTFARPTTGAYAAGDRIYPCRMARLIDTISVSRKSDDVMAATVHMQAMEPCDWPAVAPTTTYLGLPVLEDRCDWGNDRDADYARQTVVTDNNIGISDVLDPSGQPWLTWPFAWVLHGRTERAAHRSLLYWLQGRAQALWVPSGAADLVLATTLAGSSTTLTVEWAGVTRYQRQQPGRRYLRIALLDGSIFYRHVTACTDAGDTEQLGIDSALGVDVAPSDVRLISWMLLATLSSDSVQITHDTDSLGLAHCTAGFAAVPAEEP